MYVHAVRSEPSLSLWKKKCAPLAIQNVPSEDPDQNEFSYVAAQFILTLLQVTLHVHFNQSMYLVY